MSVQRVCIVKGDAIIHESLKKKKCGAIDQSTRNGQRTAVHISHPTHGNQSREAKQASQGRNADRWSLIKPVLPHENGSREQDVMMVCGATGKPGATFCIASHHLISQVHNIPAVSTSYSAASCCRGSEKKVRGAC